LTPADLKEQFGALTWVRHAVANAIDPCRLLQRCRSHVDSYNFVAPCRLLQLCRPVSTPTTWQSHADKFVNSNPKFESLKKTRIWTAAPQRGINPAFSKCRVRPSFTSGRLEFRIDASLFKSTGRTLHRFRQRYPCSADDPGWRHPYAASGGSSSSPGDRTYGGSSATPDGPPPTPPGDTPYSSPSPIPARRPPRPSPSPARRPAARPTLPWPPRPRRPGSPTPADEDPAPCPLSA
jgi:hypothetical protein